MPSFNPSSSSRSDAASGVGGVASGPSQAPGKSLPDDPDGLSEPSDLEAESVRRAACG